MNKGATQIGVTHIFQTQKEQSLSEAKRIKIGKTSNSDPSGETTYLYEHNGCEKCHYSPDGRLKISRTNLDYKSEKPEWQ